jgi:hypothetical protein
LIEHLGGEAVFFSAQDRGLSRNAPGVLVLEPMQEVLFCGLDATSREQFNRSRNIAQPHAWQQQMRAAQGGPKGAVAGAIVDPDFATPLLAAEKLKARCLDGTARLRVSRGVAELVVTF